MDTFDNTLKTPFGSLIGGMYYYLLDENSIEKTSQVIGNCNAIHSVYWSPILNDKDFSTLSVDYDIERFGKIEGNLLNFVPTLQRIKSVENKEKLLGNFKAYENVKRSKNYSHVNESRLLNFPYSYSLLTDFMNTPLEIHYHELSTNDCKIYGRGFISNKGTYSIFVQGLKGDSFGQLESITSTSPTDIPVSSTAFSNWSSTQKATDNQNLTNMIFNTNFSMTQSGVGAVGSLLSGDIGGTINNGTNVARSYFDQQQAIGNRNAKMKDLSNTPRSMITTGSDVGFSMLNGERKLTLFRYSITEEYKERLGDYFALYGYKQNKFMDININSRHYYNFIKTIGCNIINNNGIPKEHLQELKNIYDNGVTIWHIDNENVVFNDYTYDNIEI